MNYTHVLWSLAIAVLLLPSTAAALSFDWASFPPECHIVGDVTAVEQQDAYDDSTWNELSYAERYSISVFITRVTNPETANDAGRTCADFYPLGDEATFRIPTENAPPHNIPIVGRSIGGTSSASTSGTQLTNHAVLQDRSPGSDLCPLQEEQPYKVTGSSAVYYVTPDCERIPIESEAKYFSFFSSWGSLTYATETQLSQLPSSPLGFLPWGPLVELKNGELFKFTDRASVYVHIDGSAHLIASEEAFLNGGYQWSWVRDLQPSANTTYRFWNPRTGRSARSLDNTGWLPVGAMVRVEGNPEIYLLESQDGEKSWRWIDSMVELRELGYHASHIATVTEETWERLQESWPDRHYCHTPAQGDTSIRAFRTVRWDEVHIDHGYSSYTEVADASECQ